MSVYALLDTGGDGGEQVGSGKGWGDFGRWADGLDADDYAQVVHLREHGWTQQLAALESQLADALKKHPPDDADTRDVANTLLGVVRGRGDAEVLTITDGLGPSDKSDKDEGK